MSDLTAIAAAAKVEPELLGKVVDLLADFPANGKPQDIDAQTAAHMLGFIGYHEVHKRCRECGTERLDYSYFKPTAAGKLFLAALGKEPSQ